MFIAVQFNFQDSSSTNFYTKDYYFQSNNIQSIFSVLIKVTIECKRYTTLVLIDETILQLLQTLENIPLCSHCL